MGDDPTGAGDSFVLPMSATETSTHGPSAAYLQSLVPGTEYQTLLAHVCSCDSLQGKLSI